MAADDILQVSIQAQENFDAVAQSMSQSLGDIGPKLASSLQQALTPLNQLAQQITGLSASLKALQGVTDSLTGSLKSISAAAQSLNAGGAEKLATSMQGVERSASTAASAVAKVGAATSTVTRHNPDLDSIFGTVVPQAQAATTAITAVGDAVASVTRAASPDLDTIFGSVPIQATAAASAVASVGTALVAVNQVRPSALDQAFPRLTTQATTASTALARISAANLEVSNTALSNANSVQVLGVGLNRLSELSLASIRSMMGMSEATRRQIVDSQSLTNALNQQAAAQQRANSAGTPPPRPPGGGTGTVPGGGGGGGGGDGGAGIGAMAAGIFGLQSPILKLSFNIFLWQMALRTALAPLRMVGEAAMGTVSTMVNLAQTFADAENATIRLTSALAAQGPAAAGMVGPVRDMAAAFASQFGFARSEVELMMARLIGFGQVAPENLEEVTRAVFNVQAALGNTLEQAGATVARATSAISERFQNQRIALRGLRVEFNATGDVIRDMATLMDQLSSRVGTSAEAMRGSATRSFREIEARWLTLQQTLGERIFKSSAFQSAMRGLDTTISSVTERISTMSPEQMDASINKIIQLLGAIAQATVAMVDLVGSAILKLAELFVPGVEAVGNLRDKIEGLQRTGRDAPKALADASNEILAIQAAAVASGADVNEFSEGLKELTRNATGMMFKERLGDSLQLNLPSISDSGRDKLKLEFDQFVRLQIAVSKYKDALLSLADAEARLPALESELSAKVSVKGFVDIDALRRSKDAVVAEINTALSKVRSGDLAATAPAPVEVSAPVVPVFRVAENLSMAQQQAKLKAEIATVVDVLRQSAFIGPATIDVDLITRMIVNTDPSLRDLRVAFQDLERQTQIEASTKEFHIELPMQVFSRIATEMGPAGDAALISAESFRQLDVAMRSLSEHAGGEILQRIAALQAKLTNPKLKEDAQAYEDVARQIKQLDRALGDVQGDRFENFTRDITDAATDLNLAFLHGAISTSEFESKQKQLADTMTTRVEAAMRSGDITQRQYREEIEKSTQANLQLKKSQEEAAAGGFKSNAIDFLVEGADRAQGFRKAILDVGRAMRDTFARKVGENLFDVLFDQTKLNEGLALLFKGGAKPGDKDSGIFEKLFSLPGKGIGALGDALGLGGGAAETSEVVGPTLEQAGLTLNEAGEAVKGSADVMSSGGDAVASAASKGITSSSTPVTSSTSYILLSLVTPMTTTNVNITGSLLTPIITGVVATMNVAGAVQMASLLTIMVVPVATQVDASSALLVAVGLAGFVTTTAEAVVVGYAANVGIAALGAAVNTNLAILEIRGPVAVPMMTAVILAEEVNVVSALNLMLSAVNAVRVEGGAKFLDLISLVMVTGDATFESAIGTINVSNGNFPNMVGGGGSGGGGGLFDTAKDLLGLDSGGVVIKPTLAMLAEGSDKEAVIPLRRLPEMVGAIGGRQGFDVRSAGAIGLAIGQALGQATMRVLGPVFDNAVRSTNLGRVNVITPRREGLSVGGEPLRASTFDRSQFREAAVAVSARHPAPGPSVGKIEVNTYVSADAFKDEQQARRSSEMTARAVGSGLSRKFGSAGVSTNLSVGVIADNLPISAIRSRRS